MKETTPLVSVIVPCYNHEQFVEQSLLSVLNQDYKNIELIVIDDGSEDKSVEIIRGLNKERNFIFISQENVGVSKTLNKALSIAKGTFIAFLASDDYWLPNKISRQVAFLQRHTEFKMVCSNCFIVDDKSNIINQFQNNFIYVDVTFKDIALGKKTIPALTVMVCSEVFTTIGDFDENLMIEDWDMWLRISDKYRVAGLDDILACYRKHNSNVSLVRLENMTKTRFQILYKWKDKINKELYHKIHRNLEIVGMNELGNNPLLKDYVTPTFLKMLNSRYRKLVFRYFFSR